MTGHVRIDVCGPGNAKGCAGLVLTVSSRAPIFNPVGWKDLWLFSPFSIVRGGVEVPELPGVRSKTVENAWQFLKVLEAESGWKEGEGVISPSEGLNSPKILIQKTNINQKDPEGVWTIEIHLCA